MSGAGALRGCGCEWAGGEGEGEENCEDCKSAGECGDGGDVLRNPGTSGGKGGEGWRKNFLGDDFMTSIGFRVFFSWEKGIEGEKHRSEIDLDIPFLSSSSSSSSSSSVISFLKIDLYLQ